MQKFTNTKFLGLAAAVLLFAFILGRCSAPVAHDPSHHVSAGDKAGEQEPQVYTCSMHPQIRSNDPKAKCPICGMDLIPVTTKTRTNDEAASPQLELSPRQIALLDVSTVPAERRSVTRTLRLYGKVEHDSQRLSTISAWVEGRIDELFVNFVGQRVEQGSVMAKIYSPGLITAQQELLTAKESPVGRTATLAATREKLRLLGLSHEQIRQIETSGVVQDRIALHAPNSGTLVDTLVRKGDYVSVGQPLFKLSDLGALWVNLLVPESDIGWLELGQRVEFSLPALPGEKLLGQIDFIEPTADEASRSILARVNITDPHPQLRPGMLLVGEVLAELGKDSHEKPLVVPASAPLLTGQTALVYIKTFQDERVIFEPRKVSLGPRADDYFVIEQGLSPGEQVVVNGNFRLDSELQIRGQASMMQPNGGAPPQHHQHGAEPAHAQHSHPSAPKVKQESGPTFVGKVQKLLENYLVLTEALAADDFEKAKQGADTLHSELLQIDTESLSSDPLSIWTELNDKLHHALHLIQGASDIDGIRRHLNDLTNVVEKISRNFLADFEQHVVLAYCPMADDYQGAKWLQRGTSISNPYFGASMLRCGEVERPLFENKENSQ